MVGEERRKAREAADLTQVKLAFDAGLTRHYISQLERNLKSPALNALFRICDALGVRASELIARMEQARPDDARTDPGPDRPRAGPLKPGCPPKGRPR